MHWVFGMKSKVFLSFYKEAELTAIKQFFNISYDFVFLGIDEIKKYGSGPAQINMLKNEV